MVPNPEMTRAANEADAIVASAASIVSQRKAECSSCWTTLMGVIIGHIQVSFGFSAQAAQDLGSAIGPLILKQHSIVPPAPVKWSTAR